MHGNMNFFALLERTRYIKKALNYRLWEIIEFTSNFYLSIKIG